MPEGVYWSPVFGAYVCAHGSPVKIECMELNLRLDTFTRCQETTDVYVSLVEEMLKEIELCHEYLDDLGVPSPEYAKDIVYRAKQIMGDKK